VAANKKQASLRRTLFRSGWKKLAGLAKVRARDRRRLAEIASQRGFSDSKTLRDLSARRQVLVGSADVITPGFSRTLRASQYRENRNGRWVDLSIEVLASTMRTIAELDALLALFAAR
jgi:hypothetical protein